MQAAEAEAAAAEADAAATGPEAAPDPAPDGAVSMDAAGPQPEPPVGGAAAAAGGAGTFAGGDAAREAAGGEGASMDESEPEAAPLTGAGCPLCGTPNSLLQRHAVVFCAADGCGFRLDTTGDALSVSSLSEKAFAVLAAHNSVCKAAPSVYERHRVLFLECAECLTCEVLA